MDKFDGPKLRSLRRAAGLTMRGLDRKCIELTGIRVPPSLTSQAEEGGRQPREDKVRALATVFGIEPGEFYQEAA